MLESHNIFNNKKILIYGLGKSGLSASKFLKRNNKLLNMMTKKIRIMEKLEK